MQATERPIERPIRVLMVTTAWPHQVWGGTTAFIERQVRFLKASGVHVDVYHFLGAQRPINYVRAWWQVKRRLAREPYDLIHAQFGQSGFAVVPTRLPLVVTFRGEDLQGVLDPKSGRPSLANRALPLLCRVVARLATQVVVVSDHMKQFLPSGVNAHVIPSGIDFDQFELVPQNEARRRLGLPTDRKLVLFIGDPGRKRKRFPLAKQAVDLVNASLQTELVIGWERPHAEIVLLVNACDALIFTSSQEGSPNAVKEALACNLPVVSVAVGDVAYRLRGLPQCEVCGNDDPKTLAAALERVLRRGERGRSRETLADIDERVITRRLISIYRSALSAASSDALTEVPREQSGAIDS